jgi:hypothetical protein
MGTRITDADETPSDGWGAEPRKARWYGEVIAGRPGETDHFYGYSADEDPDPDDLLPDGWELIESKRVAIDR